MPFGEVNLESWLRCTADVNPFTKSSVIGLGFITESAASLSGVRAVLKCIYDYSEIQPVPSFG